MADQPLTEIGSEEPKGPGCCCFSNPDNSFTTALQSSVYWHIRSDFSFTVKCLRGKCSPYNYDVSNDVTHQLLSIGGKLMRIFF